MREEHRRRVLCVCDDVKFLMGIDFCRFGGWLQVTAGAPIDKAPIVGDARKGPSIPTASGADTRLGRRCRFGEHPHRKPIRSVVAR